MDINDVIDAYGCLLSVTKLDGGPYPETDWRTKYIQTRRRLVLFFFGDKGGQNRINLVFKSDSGHTLTTSTCRLGDVIYDPDTVRLTAKTRNSVYTLNLRI